MVLVVQGIKEEGKDFFYCFAHNISFWQSFILLLWSFFTCCCKGCDFLQTSIGGWLENSSKQTNFEPPTLETKHLVFSPKIEDLFSLPQILEVVPYTPKSKPSKCPHNHENPK
jgi:hypothetical protein